MASNKHTRPAPAAPVRKTTERGFVAEWTWTVLILLFFTAFEGQVMAIPTSSMHDTLLTGDHLLVDKLAYSPAGSISRHLLPYEDVKRGDIIVFRLPTHLEENYVKRVIGIPGDHVKLVNEQLWLNGRAVKEPYVIHSAPWSSDLYRDNFPQGADPGYPPFPGMRDRALTMLRDDVSQGELVVPPGNYLAMGDNRDVSLDSRYWGLVPRANIIGKPAMILWSYDAPTEDLETYNVHHFVDLAQHFFSKTRWNRTLKLVQGYPLR
jgi:signal peptidase I